MTTLYIDPNLIFAENAPTQDKPAAFGSYDRGWDAARSNDGRPTIKQSNFLQQQNDLKNRYIHENGAALPYKDGIAYEENAVVVKDGVLQQWNGGVWVLVGDDKLSKSSNLSDVQDAEAARTNLGLGTAATATLTTSSSDITFGHVLKVGDFGVGYPITLSASDNLNNFNNGEYIITTAATTNAPAAGWVQAKAWTSGSAQISKQFWSAAYSGDTMVRQKTSSSGPFSAWQKFYGEWNTTVDSNGFIKRASPIVQLFADKIELNDEAQLQEIVFEKLGVGDYLIKGSSGFAQDGWYIETPKDANGNVLVAVVYEQLENGDISVKTYDYMLNNKGRIVADTETPLDIPESRWIDLRLQELPTNID